MPYPGVRADARLRLTAGAGPRRREEAARPELYLAGPELYLAGDRSSRHISAASAVPAAAPSRSLPSPPRPPTTCQLRPSRGRHNVRWIGIGNSIGSL